MAEQRPPLPAGRIVVGLVGVVAAVAAFWGATSGAALIRARRTKERATANWGLDAASRDRIYDAIEREISPLLQSTQFEGYARGKLDLARKANPKLDTATFYRALGREAVARGVARLPDPDLLQMHGLRKKLAFASKRICPCFWDPSGCSEADMMDGLARLSPAEIGTWAHLSATAVRAEIADAPPVAPTAGDLRDGLVAISQALPEKERTRLDAVLDPADPKATPSQPEQCFAMKTIFTGTDKLPPADRVRFARALADAGVER